MQFEVRTLTAEHEVRTQVLEALDEAELNRLLQQQGLSPLSVRTLTRASSSWSWQRGSRRFSLLLWSQELLALLEAGLGLVESLEALREKEAVVETRALLDYLLARLREGLRFSVALSQRPDYFSALYVGMVQAAEGTSQLPQALQRFIAYQQRVDAVRSRLISASIYPVILIAVGGAVALFLLGYVVPRFAVVYQGSGRDLPWMSALLIGWGHWVATHAQWAAGVGLVSLLTLIWWVRRSWRSGALFRALYQVPGMGERARILELSRLYLTLGMLLEGGIAIRQALDMVASASAKPMREALFAVRDRVVQGQSLSEALEQHALTTLIALRMLRVGERSGQMGLMLTRSAIFYEGETTRWVERFTKTFEPALMAAIGLVIGLIVVLLYMPIFELAGSFQ